jgi:hypothetical protein
VVCGVIAALVLFVVGAPTEAAAAPRTLIPPVYAEPDLVEESTALGMLLRSTLGTDARPVVPAADLAAAALPTTMAGAADGLKRLGADRLLWGQLDRVGPLLVLRATLLDEAGATIASVTGTAQEGEVAKLLGEVLAPLRAALGLEETAVPTCRSASSARSRAPSAPPPPASGPTPPRPCAAPTPWWPRSSARPHYRAPGLEQHHVAAQRAPRGRARRRQPRRRAGGRGCRWLRAGAHRAGVGQLGISDSAGARAELDGVGQTPDATLARAAVATHHAS